MAASVNSKVDFSAQIDKWTKKTEQRMLAVFRDSTQRLVSLAQSRIPIDTGFARASIRASTESMPSIDASASGEAGQSYSYDAGQITMVIVGAKLGQTIYIGWTANYVIYLEYGHSKQAPAGFVRITALEWQSIVNQSIAAAKARVG